MSHNENLLHRAFELARAGIGLASPNPYVGAVIADANGNIVGTGTYTYAGVKHAEILALEEAGARARGGTLYINLEPHAHQGRTPPCTDALIAAGIRRVVASMADPNPKVSGRGFEQLRSAGIQVEVGGLEEEARRLNESFAKYIRRGVPFVTLKSAMTLDGKIALSPAPIRTNTAGFTGQWITGEAAREHVQELRHQNDAILCGVATIVKDNPLLTDRSGRERRRRLLRVVLDSRLRIPVESRFVQSAATEHKNDAVIFCVNPEEGKRKQLESLGVRIEQVAGSGNYPERPDLGAVLRRLGELEIASVMIEGGATVNWSVLHGGVVDKIFFYYAPIISARNGGVPLASGFAGEQSSLPRVRRLQLHRFGEDFAVEGYLRDPYENWNHGDTEKSCY
jgi:diaminohydroxyphosphoribosylaminopyrimidine deaminase / 5-amino-6-(5-phosphoribosylamino)uracil reductase